MATGDYVWFSGGSATNAASYYEPSATGGYATSYYSDGWRVAPEVEQKPKTVVPEIEVPEELL